MPDVRDFAAILTANNDARARLERARVEGVRCSQCGATVALPPELSIPSFPCRYCNASLVPSQYVPQELLRGLGMRAHLDQIMADAQATSRQRDRVILIGALVLSLAILGGILAMSALTGNLR